ncbi:MAG TPA: glycosyltransferase, partial [Candidatus Tyrphobacter sp.]|nr:glycosyltransferase [Candidatus Tyrphobacter sp.]
MITVLYAFLDTLEWMVVLFTFYTLLIPFGGFKRERRKTLSDPKSSFAIIIPAHNEEKVIGCLVESCSRLDYPAGLFDIYVIADNCSDGTVNVAGAKGAIVLKRKN